MIVYFSQIVTRLWLSRLRNSGSIPTKGKRYFSQKRPEQFRGLPTLGSLAAGVKESGAWMCPSHTSKCNYLPGFWNALNCIWDQSSSPLARQPLVGPGLLQKFCSFILVEGDLLAWDQLLNILTWRLGKVWLHTLSNFHTHNGDNTLPRY